MESSWIAYNELAWTEDLLADPSDHKGEVDATFIYLIRRKGELTIHTECHVLGLFPQAVWEKVFAEAGLSLQETDLDGIYDKYLLGGGEYPLKIFVGKKR